MKNTTLQNAVLMAIAGLVAYAPVGTSQGAATSAQTGGPIGACAASGTICVGADSHCTFSDLQDAIDAVSTSSRSHVTILVAKNQTYRHSIDIQDRNITLRGGYSSCTAYSASGTTTLYGSTSTGVGLGSVIRAGASSGHRSVALNRLTLRDGKPAPLATLRGGGVSIQGKVSVTIENSSIKSNGASDGGGIYLDGSNGAVVTLSNTSISNNTASALGSSGDGGGIYCKSGGTITMSDSSVLGNVATVRSGGTDQSRGGGMFLDNCQLNATGGTGGIRLNLGNSGGGVYATDSDVMLQGSALASFSLAANIAGTSGGGMFLDNTVAQLDGVSLDDNQAGYADVNGGGGAVYMFNSNLDVDSQICAGCSTIKGNSAGSNSWHVAIASDVSGSHYAVVNIKNTTIAGNEGDTAADMIFMAGSGTGNPTDNVLILNNVLATGNTGFTLADVDGGNNGVVRIVSSTITNNSFSGYPIYNYLQTPPISVINSILYEGAGKPIVQNASGVTVKCVMTNSGSGLPSATNLVVADPRFVDAPGGDFHLQANSPAIDFCTYQQYVTNRDLDDNPRGQDAPQATDRSNLSWFDLGAYEWYSDIIFADGFEN